MAVCPACKNRIEEHLSIEVLTAEPGARLVCLVVCPNCDTVLGAMPEEVAIPDDLRTE